MKSVGFDEVRVRYRQTRRALLHDVIVNQLTGDPLKKYIVDQVQKLIEEEDRNLFIEDVEEDLQEISLSRIAGLGITPEQLKIWLQLR